MAVTTTNLGVITAYGDAVAAGYTGTKAEWQALMASYATVGQQAVDAKNAAVAAKDTAVSKATEATTAANTATTKANEASASAQSIAQSAAQIQENTDDIEQLKSEINRIDNAIYLESDNLLDYKMLFDVWKQGTPTNSDLYQITSSKIPVNGGAKLYSLFEKVNYSSIGNITELGVYIYEYDSSDSVVVDRTALANTDDVIREYTLNANTVSIRICFSTKTFGVNMTPTQFAALNDRCYVGYKNIASINEVQNKYIPVNDEFPKLVETLNESILSTDEIQSIANNGIKDTGVLPSGTLYAWGNTSVALMPTTEIANALKIYDISINVYAAGKFKVGLATLNGNIVTIEKVADITANNTGLYSVETNWDIDKEKVYYLFASINGGSGRFSYNANTYQSSYYSFNYTDIEVGTESTISETSGNGLNCISASVLYYSNDSIANTVTVAKSGGDYSTIQDAVNNTDENDTIIVYPGVYEEVVIVPNSGGRNIIGVDRENCIIKATTGKYQECPLKIYGDFHIENLTLIATAEDAGEWYPTWDPSDNTTFGSYAIHIDGSITGNNGKRGIARNCTFYSECSHAVGAGAQIGYTLVLENCEIIRNTNDDHYLSSNYDGAMSCHSPNTNQNDNGSHFVMRDCTVINQNHEKALQLFKVYPSSPFDAEIKGCTFKDVNGIDGVIKFWNGTASNMITIMSHSNSTDECNYRAIHS